jgi:hypothetical protein
MMMRMKINILMLMMVEAATMSVCVCVCVLEGGEEKSSITSASTPICARLFDITLERNVIKGKYHLIYDTPMVEINLFVLVVPLRIIHT